MTVKPFLRWLPLPIACLSSLFWLAPVAAHVGSPNVYYEGDAGPFSVRVVIRPPTAIPGVAEVTITTADGVAVEVLATGVSTGGAAPPPATVARSIPGAAGMYSAELWLLEAGAYAVDVRVSDTDSSGKVVVPLNAVSRAPAAMPLSTLVGLVLVAVGLVLGAAYLGAAATAGGQLRGGSARRRNARLGALVATAVVLLALGAGFRAWWRYDRAFRSLQLFEPMPIRAVGGADARGRHIVLARVPDARGSRAWPRLVTDHGKLMHAFLIREPTLDAFAHIHPQPSADGDYIVAVRHLPGGTYRLYADITEEIGMSQTLTAMLTLPEKPLSGGTLSSDKDDSWHVGAPVGLPPLTTATTSELAGGYRMTWENPEVAADPASGKLRFSVVDGAGNPAHLEPYMGMLGHAAVRRLDASVFAHLHPVGSISMAAQDLFARGGAAATGHGGHDMHARHHHASSVSFPFEFPATGPYRIWVQVKAEGRVFTGVFDAQVTEIQ